MPLGSERACGMGRMARFGAVEGAPHGVPRPIVLFLWRSCAHADLQIRTVLARFRSYWYSLLANEVVIERSGVSAPLLLYGWRCRNGQDQDRAGDHRRARGRRSPARCRHRRRRARGRHQGPCVRVRIEGAEGQSLSLNDVTANTKWVGDVIEELDPISSSYTLEVSSPGMARPLRRPVTLPALWARTASSPLQPPRAVASTPARLPLRPRPR